MKKTLLLSGLCAIVLSATAQVPVPEINKGVYNKATATWCPPCGAWGWDANEEINDAIKENHVTFTLQGSSSGDLFNQHAGDMVDQIGIGGWPAFIANYSNKTVSSGSGINVAQTKTDVIAALTDFESAPVDVQVGYTAEIVGNDIKIESTVKFFNAGDGVYHLNAYAIENGPMNSQSGKSGVVEHHHVMRTGAGSAWGDKIAEGTIAAGSTFDKSFTIPMDAEWDANKMEVALVITKLVDGVYEFVNANGNPNRTVGIDDAALLINEVKVYPNPASENTVIRVNTLKATNINVDVFNALGQNVLNVFNGRIADQKNLLVNTSDLNTGIYFVKVTSGEKVRTVRLQVVH